MKDKIIILAIVGLVGFTLVTVIDNSKGLARIEVAVESIAVRFAYYEERLGRLERH